MICLVFSQSSCLNNTTLLWVWRTSIKEDLIYKTFISDYSISIRNFSMSSTTYWNIFWIYIFVNLSGNFIRPELLKSYRSAFWFLLNILSFEMLDFLGFVTKHMINVILPKCCKTDPSKDYNHTMRIETRRNIYTYILK